MLLNYSVKGESVSFCPQGNLIFILDILYVQDIKLHISELSRCMTSFENLQNLFANIFPYSGGTSVAIYPTIPNQGKTIAVEQIKKQEFIPNSLKLFGSDSGIIAIVDKNIFVKFCELFNYDDFVENLSDTQHNSFLEKINQLIGFNYAIIVNPGMGKGYEFDGGGLYSLETALV
jgi:hypothetical protein